MSFIDKVKNGLRGLKWAASKEGRQYRQDYKIDKEGMKISYEKTNYHNNLKKGTK